MHLWWFRGWGFGIWVLKSFFGVGISVDGVWGMWHRAFLVLWSWGSLYKHRRITLGKNFASVFPPTAISQIFFTILPWCSILTCSGSLYGVPQSLLLFTLLLLLLLSRSKLRLALCKIDVVLGAPSDSAVIQLLSAPAGCDSASVCVVCSLWTRPCCKDEMWFVIQDKLNKHHRQNYAKHIETKTSDFTTLHDNKTPVF